MRHIATRAVLMVGLLMSQHVFAGKKPPASGWSPVTLNKNFTELPSSSDSTINPLRGYYRWRNQEFVPQAGAALDVYQRYEWSNLEPVEGQYDFSALLADMQTANSQGKKFAFRIRMMRGYDDGLIYLPAWMVNHSSCAAGCGWWTDYSATTPGLTFVPDWNDTFVQQRAAQLLQALAQAIGNQASGLAWIDIGMYGQYGEWALSSNINYSNAPVGISAPTNVSKRRYVDMHLNAFPQQQMVMFALYSSYDAVKYATLEQVISSLPVGLRIDCLGRVGFMNQWVNHPTEWGTLQNQWQRAPFIAEFCSFGTAQTDNNADTALQQLRDYHISTVGNGNLLGSWESFSSVEQQTLQQIGREAGHRYRVVNASVNLDSAGKLTISSQLRNDGNAPSYESWDVQLELLNSNNQIVWSQIAQNNLKQLTGNGSSLILGGNWQLPALGAGNYKLRLFARDARRNTPPYRAPLKWHVQERDSDGGVTLATLTRR